MSKPQITATVLWFDRKKGFGFCKPEDGGEDIFVHQRNLLNDSEDKKPELDEGDVIYFEMGDYNGRPTAMKVKLPPGKTSKPPPKRSRGRDAKKRADAEAAAESQKAVDDSVAAATAGMEKLATSSQKEPANGLKSGAGGGRDGKTHRSERNDTRAKRNDKGVGGRTASGNNAKKERSSREATQLVEPASMEGEDESEA